MCTGDNLETAKAIAIESGICQDNHSNYPYTFMTGKEFREAVGGLKKIENGIGEEIEIIGNMKKFKEIK
jgi:magnesium-transporting ATPase (P-type)